jgi:predicted dehydrogenase
MINVGIIGCGLVGRKRSTQLAGARLAWCCDHKFDNAFEVGNKHKDAPKMTSNWEDVLNDSNVDTVVIATTHNMLAPISKAAIIAGKNVLIEKPVCKNVSELHELIELKNEHNAIVRVGFNHRYHPAITKARRLIENGSIGDLMHMRARYGHGGRKGYDREWRSDPALAAGGELVEQGIHIVDLSRWFLGTFTEVEGFATTSFWDQQLDDNAFLTLRTEDLKTAFMHVSCTEWKNTFSLEIYGRDGKIQVDGLGGSYGVEKCTLYERPYDFGYPDTTIWEYPGEDRSWNAEFDEFVRDISLKRNPSASLENALEAWNVINKIYARS